VQSALPDGITLDPWTLIATIIVANLLMGIGLLAVTRGYLTEVPGASQWRSNARDRILLCRRLTWATGW
jgi:hypothetical protein